MLLQVREYSFLSNLRLPSTVLASQATTAIDTTQPRRSELTRLKTDYADVKVLRVNNLHELLSSAASGQDLYSLGVLDHSVARRLEHGGLHSVGGSWCCAPLVDKDAGMPNNHHFSLQVLPRGRAATSEEEDPFVVNVREAGDPLF